MYQGKYHSISFTGGEPLLQIDFLKEILRLTKEGGYKNYLETNGTLPGELESVIDDLNFVSMDFKFPSSANMGNLWGFHRRFFKIASRKEVFLKAVICEDTQLEDLREALKLIKDINKFTILILQPNSQEDYFKTREKCELFKAVCRADNITACIIPQMHKVAGIK